MSADLDFGKLAFKFQGNFELDRQYEKLDCVYHDYSTYLAINTPIIGEEPSSSSNWVLMCQGYGLASEYEVTVGVDNKAISAKELKKLIQSFKATKVGTMLFSYADLLDGYLLCNGATISRNTYSALFSIIGTKFGGGDGSTSFKLPDTRGRVLQGANGNSGNYINAGLPNIHGSLGAWTRPDLDAVSGAFSNTHILDNITNTYVSTSKSIRVVFNAASSNNIYGGSVTVQPPALLLNCFIKY